MKSFARQGSSAQTGKLGSAGNNPNRAVATFPSRATGFESMNLICGLVRASPHLALFDIEDPKRSGSLAGESYASVLENHPHYPRLRRVRDADLLALLDLTVETKIKTVSAFLLPPLGFDAEGIALYQSAAIAAFRDALPIR